MHSPLPRASVTLGTYSPTDLVRRRTLVFLSLSVILSLFVVFGAHPLNFGIARLSVRVDIPAQTVGQVTLRWEGVQYPQADDYIAVYNPPYVPYLSGPQGTEIYAILANSSSTYSSGFGKVIVRLANLRTPYNFGYWSNGKLVAFSEQVPAVVEYPAQGHLGVDKNGQVILMWADSNYANPVVYYGSNPNAMKIQLSSSSYSYGIQKLLPCAVNGTSLAIEMFRDPGVLHAATFPKLSPNGIYYYKFGSSASGFSSVFEFKAPPPVTANQPTTIATYADMGTSLCNDPTGGWCGIGVHCVVEYIKKELDANVSAYDNLIHVGDLSYAVARAYRWDMWMNEIEPIAARVPYMVSLGNHEFDYVGQSFFPSWSNFYNDSDGECGVPTRERFLMPWNDDEWWYSYDVGNVHIIMLTFEVNFEKGSVQYNWFLKDLLNVDRSRTPWVIVTGHRPMYSSGYSPEDLLFAKHIRDEIEESMFKYKVDLFLTGHYHNYERTCAVYREKCVAGAPVHVLVGTAGIELENDDWINPQPEWSKSRMAIYGHAKISTANSTSLHFELISCSNGAVLDEFYLSK